MKVEVSRMTGTYIYVYYVSTGKDHRSVASIGMSNNDVSLSQERIKGRA